METLDQSLMDPAQGQAQNGSKMRRPHRPRKDYTSLDTLFGSLDNLKTALRQYIDNASAGPAPEYISCAMTLSSQATLPLKSPSEGPYAQGGPNFLPFDVLAPNGQGAQDSDEVDQFPMRTVQDLVDIQDLKERQTWQRAAAKGVVNAIQDLDGFKYCFNNNWTSKDDNGYRYSYTCLDSLENKDRHANGFRATNAAKRRPGANTRGVRKPTYDCKGQIAVKFSGVRQAVEVVYKHHHIHKTVAERRPPPRKDAKRRELSSDAQLDDSAFDFAAQTDGDFLFEDPTRLNMSPVPSNDTSMPISSTQAPYSMFDVSEEQPAVKRGRGKAKDVGPPKAKRQKSTPDVPSEDRPMSLAEILQHSMKSAPTAQMSQPTHRDQQPLSSWPEPDPITHPGPTGHYQPHPSQQGLLQLGHSQPLVEARDVGRFSKLSVPCFKCKAASTQCDGRQPTCNSCQIRGTVCNYPSVLRFDKQPMESGWIQVQPLSSARNVFRVNQQSHE